MASSLFPVELNQPTVGTIYCFFLIPLIVNNIYRKTDKNKQANVSQAVFFLNVKLAQKVYRVKPLFNLLT